MLALIDGDIFRYRHGFAGQKTALLIHTDDGVASYPNKTVLFKDFPAYPLEDVEKVIIPEPIENVLHAVKVTIQQIINDTQATDLKIFLTGAGNFREELVDYYKANRASSDKPVHYKAIGTYLQEVWGAEVVDGYEADDALAMEQYQEYLSTREDQHYGNPVDYGTIICSIDKDLDMVPGWHYNFVKRNKYFITENEGLYNFFHQMLTGDAVDNIKGIKGIGAARAGAILRNSLHRDSFICNTASAYAVAKEYDDPEEAMIINGRLLWMLRDKSEAGTFNLFEDL